MEVVEVITIMEGKEESSKRISLKDVQALFRPFQIVEAIFVLTRYQIKGNLVVQNSLLYNIFSGIFGVSLTACLVFVNLQSSYAEVLTGLDFVKFFCDVQEMLLLSVGNLISYVTNVIKAPSNVLLPSITQNLCEIIYIHGQGHIFKKFVFINWVWVAYSVLSEGLWIIIFKYAFHNLFEVDQVVSFIVYIIYDTHVLYGARIIKLMRIALQMWINDARKSDFSSDSEKEDYWNNMFAVYMEIFDAYKTVADAFHPAILFYYIKILDNTIFSIYLRVEIGKLDTEDSFIKLLAITLVSLCWLYKDLLVMITFSVMCEKFYTAMREAKSICSQLIASKRSSETQKKICKNIIRHQEVSFEKMNACGLFVVDAALILHFCSLLTTYVIVVFQFEFL